MTATDLARTDVVTAARDTPAAEIPAALASRDAACVVVLDEDAPVGLVTDRDLVAHLAAHPDLSGVAAADLMGEVVTVPGTTSAADIVERMREAEVEQVAAVDERGGFEGIVDLSAVFADLGRELAALSDLLAGGR